MSDDTELDRLERLNHLRESGALTNEEFEAKKRDILSAGQKQHTALPRWVLGAIGVVALTAVAGVSAFWIRSTGNDSAAFEEAAVAHGVPEAPIGPQPTPIAGASAPSESELLAFATSESVIGMTPTFLEQKLGMPKEKRPTSLVYDIGRCIITYWFDNGEVTTFFFDVTRSCRVMVRGTRVGPNTTFGDISNQRDGGALTARCLSSCGNAADPTIDLRYRAARVNNDIGVNFSSDYDQSSEALLLWEQAVRQQQGLGEFAPTYGSDAFSCAIDPPENVKRLATRLQVRTVWVFRGEAGPC